MTSTHQSSINQQLNNDNNDQFKATKLWNEILRSFYKGIELRNHRKQMKTFANCFTSSEAITWLKNYLKHQQQQPNDNGIKITRSQALNLLRKYHQANLIEPVAVATKEIKDNGDLYRFVDENIDKILNNCDYDNDHADGDYDSIQIELNLNEKYEIYRQTMCFELLQLYPLIENHVKFAEIDGQTIMTNHLRVNTNGVVQLTDKSADLPPWIMSAMKCLANWPKATGSANCLPKYPGFEIDVFKLICDYFTNMDDPIIPVRYYRLFIEIHQFYLKSLNHSNQDDDLSISDNYKHLNELGLPENCVYETIFSDKEPVTKIVPISQLSDIFPDISQYLQQQQLKNLNSPKSTTNGPLKPFPALATAATAASKDSPNHTFNASSTMPRKNRRNHLVNGQCDSNDDRNRKFYSLQRRKSSESCSKSSEFKPLSNNYNLKSNDYYELIQLLLFTLPNVNRRYLHLLIRLFARIIENQELCLLNDTNQSMISLKQHIVNTFTRCILRSDCESTFNEQQSSGFVRFLIDEYLSIFRLPQRFRNELDKRMNETLKEKQKNKGYSSSDTSFCTKISSDEYESQRDSRQALNELLKNIMFDNNQLSERDKLRWIKQFKMYHPDVYDDYFANGSTMLFNDYPQQKSTNQPKSQRNYSTLSHFTTKPNESNMNLFVKRFFSLKISREKA